MYVPSSRRILVPALIAAAFLLAFAQSPAVAQEGDNFEGAIWHFELKKKGSSPSTVKGQFRVSDHVIYQKEHRDSPNFDKKVGTNKPNGKRTRTEFEDLRVFDADRNPSQFIGVANLRMDELGEWSGGFTDSGGANWAMKVSRVKE